MPRGELTIYLNGTPYDAYDAWGVSMDSTALSALMTPAPLKNMITNKVEAENGTRIVRTGRLVDERTLTLGLNISAPTKEAFFSRYSDFCTAVLSNGKIDLSTKYQPGVIYHLDYLSCSSFGEYCQSMGKFVLRVIESNPTNRT